MVADDHDKHNGRADACKNHHPFPGFYRRFDQGVYILVHGDRGAGGPVETEFTDAEFIAQRQHGHKRDDDRSEEGEKNATEYHPHIGSALGNLAGMKQ